MAAVAQQKDGHPNVILRAEPGGVLCATLQNGTMLRIIETRGDDMFVEVDGRNPISGWAKSENVQARNAAQIAVAHQAEGHPEVILRAVVGGSILAKIPNGTRLSVLGQGNGRLHVQVEGEDLTGWVKSGNVQILGAQPAAQRVSTPVLTPVRVISGSSTRAYSGPVYRIVATQGRQVRVLNYDGLLSEEEIAHVFKVLDPNGDGTVSKDGMIGFLQSFSPDRIPNIMGCIEKADVDSNGMVRQFEFVEEMQKAREAEALKVDMTSAESFNRRLGPAGVA